MPLFLLPQPQPLYLRLFFAPPPPPGGPSPTLQVNNIATLCCRRSCAGLLCKPQAPTPRLLLFFAAPPRAFTHIQGQQDSHTVLQTILCWSSVQAESKPRAVLSCWLSCYLITLTVKLPQKLPRKLAAPLWCRCSYPWEASVTQLLRSLCWQVCCTVHYVVHYIMLYVTFCCTLHFVVRCILLYVTSCCMLHHVVHYKCCTLHYLYVTCGELCVALLMTCVLLCVFLGNLQWVH